MTRFIFPGFLMGLGLGGALYFGVVGGLAIADGDPLFAFPAVEFAIACLVAAIGWNEWLREREVAQCE